MEKLSINRDMSLSINTKRKKRRTRKCLNEIRNRSHRRMSAKSIQVESQQFSNVCILGFQKNNHVVTTDRITLQSMFPKAVRSETVTRPILAELKQKQGTNIMHVKDKVENTNQEIVCNVTATNTKFGLKVSQPDFSDNVLYKENVFKNHNQDDKSSTGVKLLSSTCENKPYTSNVLDEENIVATSAIASSSQSSQGDYRHYLYEEFMSELPSYFRHCAPSIIKDNVIKNAIMNLQKLYVESFQKEYEENILKCMNGHTMIRSKPISCNNETIVENPLDYIRLRQQNMLSESPATVADSLSIYSESSSDSVCLARTPLVNTPTTPTRVSTSSVLDVVLHATPDYDYYPHRLN